MHRASARSSGGEDVLQAGALTDRSHYRGALKGRQSPTRTHAHSGRTPRAGDAAALPTPTKGGRRLTVSGTGGSAGRGGVVALPRLDGVPVIPQAPPAAGSGAGAPGGSPRSSSRSRSRTDKASEVVRRKSPSPSPAAAARSPRGAGAGPAPSQPRFMMVDIVPYTDNVEPIRAFLLPCDPTSGLPIGLDELNRLSALSQEDRNSAMEAQRSGRVTPDARTFDKVEAHRREATRSATPSKAPLFPKRPDGTRDRSSSLSMSGDVGGIATPPPAPAPGESEDGAGPAAAISPRVKRTMAAQRMRVNVSLGMDAHAPVSRTPKEPSTRKASSLVPRRSKSAVEEVDEEDSDGDDDDHNPSS